MVNALASGVVPGMGLGRFRNRPGVRCFLRAANLAGMGRPTICPRLLLRLCLAVIRR